MAKSNDGDPWKRHLVEAEAELEEKTQQLQDTQVFFCSVIARLAHLLKDDISPFRAEIDAIKDAAKNASDLTILKSSVESLTTKIIRSDEVSLKNDSSALVPGSELQTLLEKVVELDAGSEQLQEVRQRVANISSASELAIALDDVALIWKQSVVKQTTSAEDPSQFCAQLISEILYQLLEKVSFPQDLSLRLNALKMRLDEGVTISKWSGMLNQISDIASDVQSKINRERMDIEAFLKQVTSRLKDLDGYILGTKEQHAVAWKHGNALGDAVKNEMQNLVSNANDTLDINVLKEQIQARLATIEDHVNGFRETEKNQHQHADSEVQRLISRLNELELESQKLKARVKKERMQAQIDTLTGIANRLGYDHRIAQEYARWKRFSSSLSLVVWDIDLFKRINDELGHASGDNALKAIAKLLSENIRETDYLARYGGEEFVLIMPGADRQAAKGVADKLRSIVEHTKFHFKGKPVSITISAGIAEFKTGDTNSSVFDRADKALYRAKKSGRNKVMLDEN